MLTIGTKAPDDVKVSDENGIRVSLADYKGKYVVIYFYPKDDTPGCTTESCSIEDWNEKILGLGAAVIGVSKDSPKSHIKFKEKYHLSFPLWADEEHRLMDAFGTWGEKTFAGRAYMGTTRSTFLIDPEGIIRQVWEKVTPTDHGKDIFESLQKAMGE